MWNLDLEESYFRIYDSKRQIAGYFDPDYGEIFPQEKEHEIIEQMHKNHDKILGGFIMVPMVKFGIFEANQEMYIDNLEKNLALVSERLAIWRDFILKNNKQNHMIQVSHTDQDMLSITFPIRFAHPVVLEKKVLLSEIEPFLESMRKQGLL